MLLSGMPCTVEGIKGLKSKIKVIMIANRGALDETTVEIDIGLRSGRRQVPGCVAVGKCGDIPLLRRLLGKARENFPINLGSRRSEESLDYSHTFQNFIQNTPQSPDSNRIKALHISQLMPHKLLHVPLDLFGVIEIVVEPLVKQFTNTNKPDLRVHSRALQIARRQLFYKSNTSFSYGGKLVEQLENVLVTIVPFESYFILIVEIEPWVFLMKHQFDATYKISLILLRQVPHHLLDTPLPWAWVVSDGTMRQRQYQFSQHNGHPP